MAISDNIQTVTAAFSLLVQHLPSGIDVLIICVVVFYYRQRQARYSYIIRAMDRISFRTAGGWSSCCSCYLLPCGRNLAFLTL